MLGCAWKGHYTKIMLNSSMTSLNNSRRCFQTTKVNLSIIFCTLWIWFPNYTAGVKQTAINLPNKLRQFWTVPEFTIVVSAPWSTRKGFIPLFGDKWKTKLWDVRESTSKTKTSTNKTKYKTKQQHCSYFSYLGYISYFLE